MMTRVLTFVHARLVQSLYESERLALIRFALGFDALPQLILQLVADNAEGIHADFIVGNSGLLQETATGKLVKVVAGLDLRVHVLQDRRC